MAERCPSDKIRSNEEIIEELSKGVEECEMGDTNDEQSNQDLGGEPSESNQNKEKHSDDYIDEVELKDREITYTEEDREKLKQEAELLKKDGNELFKSEKYSEAALKYTTALRTCPLTYDKDRAILFGNRGACKLKLELNETAIEDCTKAIELDPNYVKALMRRAQLYEKVEKLDEALEDYKKVVTLDSTQKEAYIAVQRLPQQIHERNERLKTEMLGKLKDLGNMVLKPFGLSTNNFQMVQDPNTGGYSISFKQN